MRYRVYKGQRPVLIEEIEADNRKQAEKFLEGYRPYEREFYIEEVNEKGSIEKLLEIEALKLEYEIEVGYGTNKHSMKAEKIRQKLRELLKDYIAEEFKDA